MKNTKIPPLKKGTKYETLTTEEKEKYTRNALLTWCDGKNSTVRLWNHNDCDIKLRDY